MPSCSFAAGCTSAETVAVPCHEPRASASAEQASDEERGGCWDCVSGEIVALNYDAARKAVGVSTPGQRRLARS